MKFWNLIRILMVILVLLGFSSPVFAEGMTREQGDAILKELKQIRKELEEIKKQTLTAPRRGPARRPVSAKVPTEGDPVLGDAKAPLTLVEFTDYQCPFCRKFFANTLSKIKEKYIDTGKVRLVLKDLPLGFHAKARPAARAAHCAGEQGKFWDMHDALFAGGGRLDRQDFVRYAEKIGIEDFPFQECLESDRYNKELDQDVADAGKASINGTPGFVLGKTTDNEIEGTLISGAQPFASFDRAIQKLLTN